MITVAHTCSALLIAIDNINTVCEIVLLFTLTELNHGVYCDLSLIASVLTQLPNTIAHALATHTEQIEKNIPCSL